MIRYENHQIGDWILVDGTPRQIQAINKKKIGYHRKENEPRLYYARLHDVEPIEINEYIFRTSGFCVENQGTVFYADFRCDEFEIFVIPNSLGQGEYEYILLVDAHGISNYVELFDFRFVHQLQHAIRLCGVNFEVKF
jgi:hypothetical protein